MNSDSPDLRDRIITMMTGLLHFHTMNLNDLCDGLDFDRGSTDSRNEFGRFVGTAVSLDWVSVDFDAFTISLTDKGTAIAQSMARVCDAAGITPFDDRSSWDDEWCDTHSQYAPWDDAPEYPEDWAS